MSISFFKIKIKTQIYIFFVHCFSTFFGQTHVKMHLYTYTHNHSDNKDGCGGDGGGSFSDSVNLIWDYGWIFSFVDVVFVFSYPKNFNIKTCAYIPVIKHSRLFTYIYTYIYSLILFYLPKPFYFFCTLLH